MFFGDRVSSLALAVSAALMLAGSAPIAQAASTVIPKDSFSSFDDFWKYLYPWGSDHNGSARMAESQVDVDSGTLVLKAVPTTVSDKASIHYLSGAVHSTKQITVTAENSYTLYGENAASGWPPEIDIGEWKGTADNWFNTFNTSSEVKSTTVAWPTDLSFHSLQAVLTAEPNGADVRVDFSMDGALKATHYAKGYVGKTLNLIINLQMEGSSGTPAPADGATYQARNVEVTIN
ncbi:glycoside hydrolase family 16 protein [Schizophyllum commune]